MRAISTATAAIVFWAVSLAGIAPAQSAVDLPLSPVVRAPRFVGLDVFAGGGQIQNVLVPATDTEDAKYPKWGWEAGATVNLGVRWLGIVAAAGQRLPRAGWAPEKAYGKYLLSGAMLICACGGHFEGANSGR